MLIGIDASRAVVARRTGTEFYSVRLIESLLALDVDHRFRLYFNEPPLEHDWLAVGLADGMRRIERRFIPFPRLWTHLRLGLEVARHPPDVLFVPSHVLPLWTHPPAVVTVHDLGYLYFPEAHPARQRWYLNWSTAHNARTARVVIADSQATRDDLVRHYEIPVDKIRVAYPGFDEDLAPVTDERRLDAVRRRYGIRAAYFLHLGTLQPRKNLLRLVQAFARLPFRQEAQLVLAGKAGWLYDDLFAEVGRLNLEEQVLFPGYVEDEDKAALLSGATAFVFPSLYEGFGFPVLESQACNTPVVCADSSSLPEVSGAAALHVAPTDITGLAQAMARLWEDGALRDRLVAQGRRNVERFSWQVCAETVMVALEAAAEGR
jgi:glycosyltransferase involved in cell wall biosynthesis